MESWILLIVIIMPGVWSGEWRVTFKDHCALKGTSIVIKCEYDYPFAHIVTSTTWLKARLVSSNWKPFPLPTDRFTYVGNSRGDCSLKISDVQHTDKGAYFFSFVTTLNRWRSRTFAQLSVKELTTLVEPGTVTEGKDVRLTCVSDCPTPTSIVWFRDGQLVPKPTFQATKEDAGSYYCAVLGQETARSSSVVLNVQYAPKKVTLLVSPSADVIRGRSVTFTCSSDANPSVTQSGYRLYKVGQFISSGLSHTISDIQPSHSGLYHCQAWNNISWRGVDRFNSTGLYINVQYRPMNITISVDPPHVVEGGSVNLTCSSAANPAAHAYTWYKKSDSPSSSSPLVMGSGQVLSLPSMQASDTGLYLCQARNSLGENNSPEVLLAVTKKEHGSQTLLILAGAGAALFLTLLIALLLFWRKHRTHIKKKTVSGFMLSVRGSSSSGNEDQPDAIYANIDAFPSSPPNSTTAQDISPASSNHEHDAAVSDEDEITYSAVTIKPRNPSLPCHINNSTAPHNSWSEVREDTFVIYATVAKSS